MDREIVIDRRPKGISDKMDWINFHKENGIPFKVEYTRGTAKIISELGDYVFSGSGITKRGMNFIRKVKMHVENSCSYENVPSVSTKIMNSLGVVRFGNIQDGWTSGVIEFDLNRAYWTCAQKIGVIDYGIYREGLRKLENGTISKVELLASLGSLARSKHSMEWDTSKRRYVNHGLVDDSKETRHVWNAISYGVACCMRDMQRALGHDFLMYWTDACFMVDSPENLSLVEGIARRHGFEGDTVDLLGLEKTTDIYGSAVVIAWTEKKKGSSGSVVDKEGNHGRIFCPSSGFDVDKFITELEMP